MAATSTNVNALNARAGKSNMGNLSKNFSRYEFKCKCNTCPCDTADAELVKVLEQLRIQFGGRKIKITSGHRCPDHNEAVGGSENSQHLLGRAADIIVEGVNPAFVYEYLDGRYPLSFGVGKYVDFTHIDTRDDHARWGDE
jgi:uncharacterized protein YcbK (DUF882 family)